MYVQELVRCPWRCIMPFSSNDYYNFLVFLPKKIVMAASLN